ncbi:GNAT family N-acetyltransferase [Streptomyces sp. C]|uniref:GNAT family N-acetyltransferase n=1 Tax=Streptomyces sp. C TaxID=253839 RepID=UPI0001B577F3|nr:GNAT family N-acetyltransferase [Streptomyces sp. C]EFL18734.1 acetyltransferase [Streptomyces sp. C]
MPESPRFLQAVRPDALTAGLRRQLIDCWVAVANTGGAVIALEFPMPPVSARDVAPVVDRLIAGLEPERSRILVAAYGDTLAGWLVLRRDPHPLIAHCGVVNHVQTCPAFRGRGIGAALMERVRVVAREEMGLERLQLSARAGLRLEEFYGRLGWVEVGRWPGALRVAPGDDRDDILMSLSL